MAFNLKDAVEMYASVADEPFTIQAIIESLRTLFPSCPNRGDEIQALLEGEPCLFHDKAQGRFVPRAAYFKGARFLVIPTEYELERDILITGDRLVPFSCPDIFPGKAALHAPSGERIRRRRITAPLSEVAEFLSLYGYRGMFSYLETDLPENAVALARLNHTTAQKVVVQMAVYHMPDVYKAMDLAPGDGIVFTVRDWREGAFSLARVESPMANPVTLPLRNRWAVRMEDGLARAAEMDCSTIEEQIAYAFFLGGRCLVENPVNYVQGFIQASGKFGLDDHGTTPRLVARQRELAGVV
jgi:hypothetical protein